MYRFTISEYDTNYCVYVDLISSPAGHYLSRQPYVLALVRELLSTNTLSGKQLIIEQDMGRQIGKTDIIKTSEKDIIYYALPTKSEVYSRFAKNRYPQVSTKLTITLQQDEAGDYELRDAWIGADHPAFPGDEQETDESKKYWQTHALVQDAQPIQSSSITKVCPY